MYEFTSQLFSAFVPATLENLSYRKLPFFGAEFASLIEMARVA